MNEHPEHADAQHDNQGWVRRCTYLPQDLWDWIDQQALVEEVDRKTLMFDMAESYRERKLIGG